MQLFELLQLRPGIIALVGAGGKTTAMFTLAQELLQTNQRIIITTTTHIFPPDPQEYGPVFAPDDTRLQSFLQTHGIAVVASGQNAQGKLTGVTSSQIDQLAQLADYVLVEADGSRRMPCKVPASHEPALPQNAHQVVGVLGLSAVGQPFAQACFRAELACPHLSTSVSEAILPHHLANIAAQPWGLAKDTRNRSFTVLLNQKDCCSPQTILQIAQQIKEQGVTRVVATCLKNQEWNEV